MLAARAVAAKPKKTPSITPEINRSMPCSMRTSRAADELFRPALAARKASYAASMSSVPIRIPVPNMSAGTGSIQLTHMAPLSTGLQTRHNVSNVAVIGAAQARAASWLLQCSNHGDDERDRNKGNHIPPLLSPVSAIGTRIRTRKDTGWFRPCGQASEKNPPAANLPICQLSPNPLFSLANSSRPLRRAPRRARRDTLPARCPGIGQNGPVTARPACYR
jgi:hypothetical protein